MSPAAIEVAKARLRFMLQSTNANEDDIADCMAVVRDCVMEEQERCAKLADAASAAHRRLTDDEPWAFDFHDGASEAIEELAEEILK